MELEITNLKKDEDVPELLTGALEDDLQDERVTQWMRLCVGALKEWMEKLQVGEPLRRPLDHTGAHSHPFVPSRAASGQCSRTAAAAGVPCGVVAALVGPSLPPNPLVQAPTESSKPQDKGRVNKPLDS